jgi:hypothetical protein
VGSISTVASLLTVEQLGQSVICFVDQPATMLLQRRSQPIYLDCRRSGTLLRHAIGYYCRATNRTLPESASESRGHSLKPTIVCNDIQFGSIGRTMPSTATASIHSTG